jgi:hypothetical protein
MNEKMTELYKDLPEKAEQRTKGSETKKGYDTSGYGYQWLVDVLNDVYGLEWGYEWELLEVQKGNFSNGRPFFDITIKIGIWIEKKENIRALVGGHVSMTFGDALKGAITNGFKKTAAMFGLGSKAYRGQMDDDNIPQESNIKYYNNKNKFLDYNMVEKELSECGSIGDVDNYAKILKSEYPYMSSKQKETIKQKFSQRRIELNSEKLIENEFKQGEVFNDDNIPL